MGELTIDNLTESNFLAPDVVLDCTNVASTIESVQQMMMTVRLNAQGQADYEAWLQRANAIKDECTGIPTPTPTPAPTTPIVEKTTTLQPLLLIVGLTVVALIVNKIFKDK
jgi:hypothetical protein